MVFAAVLPGSAGLAALPASSLIMLGVLVAVASIFAFRVMENAFRGSAPPIDEGIPFIGGLLKFSKVR